MHWDFTYICLGRQHIQRVLNQHKVITNIACVHRVDTNECVLLLLLTTRDLNMRQPIIYTAKELKNWDVDTQHPKLGWIPARPCGHSLFSILWRWQVAFLVLIGEYDAIDWQEE